MKLPKFKLPKFKIPKWLRNYAEIVVYGIMIIAAIVWQILLYGNLMRIQQDLLIASIGLEILNLLLAVIIVKKMRLLSQLLLMSAILLSAITIYYL